MRGTVLAAALLFALSATPASAANLFDAFKTFCLDTGAKLPLVKAAVEAAHGRMTRPPAAASFPPFQMRMTGWTLALNGHDLKITAGSETDPGSTLHPETDMEDCGVTFYGADKTGLAAIVRWVGMAPQLASRLPGNITLSRYEFQMTKGKPEPVPSSKSGYAAAERAGRIWSLVVTSGDNLASAQLVHIVKASPVGAPLARDRP